jgi:membrane protease YdiL (CAAX protease family)
MVNWLWPTVWHGERGGWWRLAITLVLWLAGLVLGILLMTAIMIALRGPLNGQPAFVQDLVKLLVGVPAQHGLMLAGCLIGIRFVHRRPIASVFTDGRPFRFPLAFESAAVWAALWFAGKVCLPNGWQELAQRAGEVPPAWWPVLATATLCAIALQATQEEVVFRGYLLTRLAAWTKRPCIAVLIMTVAFTAIHLHSNPAAKVGIALFAVAFGAGCIRAGTLAPLIGLHAAHNTLETL